MLRRKAIIAAIAIAIILANVMPALAAYGYNYARTSDLVYADDGAQYAHRAWQYVGFTSNIYTGSTFTESTFLSNSKYGNGVYASTHGNSDSISDNGSGSITRSEVSSNRNSDWKRLVFLDACDTADNSNWAAAWGISSGDGNLHAYIGWVGYSYDNRTYLSFTANFWDWVAGGYTIRQALTRGKNISGVTNYRSYGNIDWEYY
jgi:hypothetical protein